jgi:hypothetical protein
MRTIRYLVPLAMVAGAVCGGPARRVLAQTTHPADATVQLAQWNATCREFVQVLSSGNSAGIASLLASGSRISSFSSTGPQAQSLAGLSACLTGQTVISQHGYLSPASTIASDVSGDFSANSALANNAVARMSFTSDADQKVANESAGKWVTQTLSTKDGQPIAIVVLWPASPSAADNPNATFILFSGQLSPSGAYQISSVVFGDPLAP